MLIIRFFQLQETLKLNLPSFIRKVEPAAQQKQEPKGESASQQSQTEVPQEQQQQEASENSSAPSTTPIDIPSPKPRTSIQVQKEPVPVPSTGSVPASAPATSAQSDDQQPNEKKSDDARVCKICYNEELGVVFLPCGHIVACVKCAPGMMTCAVCREPVTMTVRAFFS